MSLVDRQKVCNKYRFNDWLWYYGQKVKEIGKQIINSDDKKRLSNKRTKILAKMNKINESEKNYDKYKDVLTKKGKVVREVVKIYPFEADGTVKNYHMICEVLGDLKEPG